MDNTIDLLYIALGGISSLVVRWLRPLVPAFGDWFDALNDRSKQAFMLWVGIAVVLVVSIARLWGTELPADAGALAALLWQTVSGVIQMLVGQVSAFKATNRIGERRAAVVNRMTIYSTPEDGAVG